MIVEDERIIARDLCETLQNMGHKVVYVAHNFQEALLGLIESDFELLILDINLKDQKDGIDFAELVEKKYQRPFIFLTSHADKLTLEKAKKVHPCAYLIKPFNQERLTAAIEVGTSNFEKQQLTTYDEVIRNDTFFLKDKNLMKKIRVDEILCLESDNNYTKVFTTDNKFLLHSTMREILLKLPKHQFIQIHRSFVINIDKVATFKGNDIQLSNDMTVPLGRSFKQEFMRKINLL